MQCLTCIEKALLRHYMDCKYTLVYTFTGRLTRLFLNMSPTVCQKIGRAVCKRKGWERNVSQTIPLQVFYSFAHKNRFCLTFLYRFYNLGVEWGNETDYSMDSLNSQWPVSASTRFPCRIWPEWKHLLWREFSPYICWLNNHLSMKTCLQGKG